MIVRIEDVADPRIADYREVKERDRLGRGGVMVEGEVVLRKAVHGRHPIRSLLIAESRAEARDQLLTRVGRCNAAGRPCKQADAELFLQAPNPVA